MQRDKQSDNGAPRLRVEVWSDPQCVWCYIGHPRMDAAVAAFGGDVDIIHRSFQLHPGAPVDVARDEHIRSQTGGMNAEDRDRIISRLTDLAAAEGLEHRPELIQPTNSGRALELFHFADTLGQRDALARRIARAHFAEGRNIGHRDELLYLAEDSGIDPIAVEEALGDRRFKADVERDISRARSLGAQGVPFYLVNGTRALEGSHSSRSFLGFLRS